MKKKSHPKSEPTEPLSSDYVVGQVSGSLFPEAAPSSGSLSSLFSTAPPAASVMFVPPPKPVPKPPEMKKESPAAKHPDNQRKKPKTVAEQQLENRENSLQNADEEERSRTTGQKAKRKASALDEDGGGGEDEVEKKRLKMQRMAEERIKHKRTVFVGNLPPSCTKKTLQALFRDKGAIESIRFRSVVREDPTMSRKLAAIQRKVHPKKQNINAYVVFKDEEAVTMALERNGMEIEKNMHIRVDRVGKQASHDHKRSIFVGNLPFDMTELSMRQHFEECGGVEAVRLIRDKGSGMGKGFGYVLFEHADSVQLALKLNGSELEGRAIRVKRSVKKEKIKKKKDRAGFTRGPKKTPGGPEGGRGGDRGGGPRKGPVRGPGKAGFKGGPGKGPHNKNRTGKERSRGPATTSPSSFKGEMAKPGFKPKKNKALKSKSKKK